MEMHHVRYFLALCEEGNFTRAAKRCGVAQPSLTSAIKSLESTLGGELFHRGQSNTRLTELGELVKPRMQRIIQEAAQTLRIAQDYTKNESVVSRS
jgi:DNA-binding transcriptional LysR family regulator